MARTAKKEVAPVGERGLRRWNDLTDSPFDILLRGRDGLHRQLDRLFDDFWKGSGMHHHADQAGFEGALTPRVDESEDDKAIHVKVELPGMDEKDVDITLANGVLTVRGEKKRDEEEKGKDWYRSERSFGAFRRSLPIPVDVDEGKIEAKFKKGVLYIELPKTEEARSKIKHIPVKAA